MATVRRIVVRGTMPTDPTLVAFARRLTDTEGIAAANVALVERNEDAQNVTLTVDGEDVMADRLEVAIEAAGGSLHSIDGVTIGESVDTPRQG